MKKIIRVILQWIKDLMKRLAIHILSGIASALVSFLVILPFLFFFKWLFGPIPSGGVPTLGEGWYVWGLMIAWLVLFWKLELRLHQWLKQRFGLSQKASLKIDDKH